MVDVAGESRFYGPVQAEVVAPTALGLTTLGPDRGTQRAALVLLLLLSGSGTGLTGDRG